MDGFSSDVFDDEERFCIRMNMNRKRFYQHPQGTGVTSVIRRISEKTERHPRFVESLASSYNLQACLAATDPAATVNQSNDANGRLLIERRRAFPYQNEYE
jgi:hypothetical protein